MRHWTNAFRSGAFSLALLLALAFAASATLLLIVVERSVAQYAVAATEGGLRSEAAILQGEDRELGRPDLLKAIDRHRRAGGSEAFRYQLIDGAGHRLVDDLGGIAPRLGWGSVIVREEGDARTTFRSLGVALGDGGVLVVATDTYDIQDLRRRLDRFTILAGVGITLFALVGGYVTGGLFMRRLDRVNAAIARIMAGNLAERLPTIGISREFDALSANLNAMLDRMAGLMEGLRQVSTDIAHDLRTPLTRLRQQLEATRDAGSAADPFAGVESALE